MTEPPTDLNVLMSLDPLDLTKQDLDAIIAYQRKQRGQREAGVRTRKPKGESPQIDIKELLSRSAGATKPVAPQGSSFRRR